jgi:tyrosyl-DNA phosphodiesterase-1
MSSQKAVFGQKPSFKVVFPTPDEIRRSLDGYKSGRSIHTKIQSNQQQKQLQYLKPIFCHWANDAPDGSSKFYLPWDFLYVN